MKIKILLLIVTLVGAVSILLTYNRSFIQKDYYFEPEEETIEREGIDLTIE